MFFKIIIQVPYKFIAILLMVVPINIELVVTFNTFIKFIKEGPMNNS